MFQSAFDITSKVEGYDDSVSYKQLSEKSLGLKTTNSIGKFPRGNLNYTL